MRSLSACLVFLSGCSTLLGPIPGMVKVATCTTGPAYHYKDELICDDWANTAFAYRKLEPNDNAGSACVFCQRSRL